MHRTLKRDTATPPTFSMPEQQDRFNQFQRCFNEERPYEALGFATPASVYVASTRRYPSSIPEPTYADRFAVRRVGHIQWQGGLIFIVSCYATN